MVQLQLNVAPINTAHSASQLLQHARLVNRLLEQMPQQNTIVRLAHQASTAHLTPVAPSKLLHAQRESIALEVLQVQQERVPAQRDLIVHWEALVGFLASLERLVHVLV